MALITYLVEKMRVTEPTGKAAEKNPDRALSVSGVFYQPDPKDPKKRGEKYSFSVKYLTLEDISDPGTHIDSVAGVLTIPAGERGRKAAEGMAQSAIDKKLAELRAKAAEKATGK